MKLRGARVVVTGGSRGLGLELARSLATRGARLVLVARESDALRAASAELNCEAAPADLGGLATLDSLIDAINTAGPIDAFVNNAGIDLTGRLTACNPAAITQLFHVNLIAPVLLSRAVIPIMQRQGNGTILNISSIAGTNSMPGATSYASSKAGLSHFTESLRAELRTLPIKLILAEIGPIESTMMDSLRAHPPMRRALERLEMLRLVKDLPMATVVAALTNALEHDKRHVRLPLRDAVFPLLTGAPRAINRLLLTGVDVQTETP